MIVPEASLPRWQRPSVRAEFARRARERDQARERPSGGYEPPRRADGELDVPRMIAEGMSAVVDLELRRLVQSDHRTAERRRGRELYEAVYARQFGHRPPPPPTIDERMRAGIPGYSVIGTIPPDLAQMPITIF